MAIMIPSIPNECDAKSREEELFYSLKNNLSDDYYVFHSFRFIDVNENEWEEKEVDFVIFHRQKGILCIEAKAGAVICSGGQWYYQSGKEMRDPFQQAISAKWLFNKKIGETKEGKDILRDCKMQSAVWFPAFDKERLNRLVLPQNGSKELLLTGDDINNPSPAIERIFEIGTHTTINHQTVSVSGKLSKEQSKWLLNNILCPEFNILPSKTAEIDYKKEKFFSLIKEQYRLLDYLEEQRTAVINGAAGTGKTMIALEKARRHAVRGEKVLFLCFNAKLKEYLSSNYHYQDVDFYNIDGFACKMCGTKEADFELLIFTLLEMKENHSFPYEHVIIDEAQDFGQKRIHADDLFACFEELVLGSERGSFYAFYDKMQLVQSLEVPHFIEDADCRLTLYKNCRNTKRIAETSFKPLKREPKLFDSAMTGSLPAIAFVANSDEEKAVLDNMIKNAIADGIKDIQILSCATEGKSLVANYLDHNGDYPYRNQRIPFTTCRKFKGLEADKVIIVDVNRDSMVDENKVFYVGASRARLELSVIALLDDDTCRELVEGMGSFVKKNNPKTSFANLLGCKVLHD